jgi:hypothetical protein
MIAVVSTDIKTKATQDIFGPTTSVVEDVLESYLGTRPCPNLPKVSSLTRHANRARERMRPADPADLEFDLDVTFIGADFFQADVRVKRRRHLIFATSHMLQLLTTAKTWYCDGTFFVVPSLFAQLYSIHVFVRAADCIKQVPVLFCLMSGRRASDYIKVLKTVRRQINSGLALKSIVLDFESGML